MKRTQLPVPPVPTCAGVLDWRRQDAPQPRCRLEGNTLFQQEFPAALALSRAA